MTAVAAPRGEAHHVLAPHGWPMEPLVLIEDAPDGPLLVPLTELATVG